MSERAGLVIGVGNAHRGDDGVGPAVARRLESLAPDGVTVIGHGGEAADLVERFSQAEFAILIDAAAWRREAGAVHRFDAAAEPLPAALFGASTHGLGIPEAIELARALGRLPAHCVVFAVEGSDYEPGTPLSAQVQAAVEPAVQRVLDELRALASRP
ncbi:MAG: hydrogenase maturation protease [Gammaproteobacteria bacterium]|nr:hydrogenase maturation protease [Gammaproteobacteria bacterium]